MDNLFRRFSPRPLSRPPAEAFPESFPEPFVRNTHNSDNRSPYYVQGPPSIGWSSQSEPPGPHSRPGMLSYPDIHSRLHYGAHPGGFRPPGNSNQIVARTNSLSLVPQVPSTSVSRSESRDWFLAIDQDGNGELSHEELQQALLNNGGLRLSANTVKYLVSIFDPDDNGMITFDKFEPLWNYLNLWRQMFDSFDTNGEGRLDTAEFGHALANYGLRFAPEILDMVMKKYGISPSRNRQPGYGGAPARPQMDLDQFVYACIVVRQMCSLYDDCSAGRISRDDFLKAIISLP